MGRRVHRKICTVMQLYGQLDHCILFLSLFLSLTLPPSPRTVLASSLATGLNVTGRRSVSSTRNAGQKRRRGGGPTASHPHRTMGTMEVLGELPISHPVSGFRVHDGPFLSPSASTVSVPPRRRTSRPSPHHSMCDTPPLRPTAPRSSCRAPLSSRCPSTPTPPPHSRPRPQGSV